MPTLINGFILIQPVLVYLKLLKHDLTCYVVLYIFDDSSIMRLKVFTSINLLKNIIKNFTSLKVVVDFDDKHVSYGLT